LSFYWCLTHNRVEAADDRDDLENSLGPYPTEAAATNWKATLESRNEAWQEEDDRWDGPDEDADDKD
jgi:hypothetical protein